MADIKALLEVGGVMARLPAPWFVAGGWAIDLGRITREHRDVEVLVCRRDQSQLHSTLAEFPLRRIIPHPEGLINRGTPAEWSVVEQLELPLHQISAYRTANQYLTRADTTAADPEYRWWFQIILGETDDADWISPQSGDSASASSDRLSSTGRIASSRAGDSSALRVEAHAGPRPRRF